MATRGTETARSSLQARIVRAVTSVWFSLLDAERANIQAARFRINALGKLVPTASGVSVEPVVIAGLDAEWLVPESAPADRLILYLHGGAYVLGGCDSHRHMVSHIARAAGVRALVPEYSLAPENPFPAAVEDVVEVYRALLAKGYEARDIVIAGDSAGGGLAVAGLLACRDAGLPMPAAAFLLSPWLDLSASGESMRTREGHDPWFRPGDVAVIACHYCRSEQVSDPLVSPVFADVERLPPTFIQVGDDEILLSDATRLAENLETCGCEVKLDVYPGMWHVFQAFLLVVPEARAAIASLAQNIRRVLRLQRDSAEVS
jgi:epsilon-lactone hydrolase